MNNRLIDKIFPKDSKRKLAATLIMKIISDPGQFIKRINIQNIKAFIYYTRTESPNILQNRINIYLDRFADDRTAVLYKKFEFDSYKKITFKKVNKPLVSIIIPVYNEWNYTYSCLLSIYENTKNIPYEILIGDDASQDETKDITKYIENIKIIRNKSNIGFLQNCNNTAKSARGEYIVFLNNDTNVQEEWLKHLVELLEKDESIGMAGPKLIYPDGELQEAGSIIWENGDALNYGRYDDPEKSEYNYVKEADYISGACLFIRKSLYNKIKGFDKRYVPAYYEDVDLAFEVRKHGYKVVYQPLSAVLHFEGISCGVDKNKGIKAYEKENKIKFFEKWKPILQKENFHVSEHLFLARDRSRNKKTILVIDQYVPQYDKEAGSRTTYHYVKLFVEIGLQVKFLGDTFYKHEPYTTELEQMGIEVLYGDWYKKNWKEWVKNNAQHIDYVFLCRPLISIKYIDFIKKHTKALVLYQGLDLRYLREYKRYELLKNKEFLKSSKKWKKKEFKLFKESDIVLHFNKDEKEIIEKEFPNKEMYVTPLYWYENFTIKTINFTKRKNIMFVGGYSYSPNIDAVLWFVKKIFPQVIKKYPDMKFYVVGADVPETLQNLASKNVIIKGYISEAELRALYDEVKLVVIPLTYGAGVKGKLVEAMYYGIPVVTTSYGIEGLSDIQGIIQAKDTEEDFADEISALYKDSKKLAKLSKDYQNYIKNYFSKDHAIKVVRNFLKLQ